MDLYRRWYPLSSYQKGRQLNPRKPKTLTVGVPNEMILPFHPQWSLLKKPHSCTQLSIRFWTPFLSIKESSNFWEKLSLWINSPNVHSTLPALLSQTGKLKNAIFQNLLQVGFWRKMKYSNTSVRDMEFFCFFRFLRISYEIMPSTNRDSFATSFLIWMPFISFTCLTAPARNSSTMLNVKWCDWASLSCSWS